jgi:ankyrin repeat protein
MNLFKPKVKRLIEKKDYAGLRALLSTFPDLANKGITIPFDLICSIKAHPLHRICDAVIAGKITDDDAVSFAKIFLENGAHIDGDKNKNEGTPLLAAASLHAEQVGIFYIDQGADIHYTHKNDGASALHWAAFCGRDKLVARLISANAEIDEPDIAYDSTPLGWAIHALQSNDMGNKYHQLNCIKLLLKSGADTKNLQKEKNDYLLWLSKNDPELQAFIS